MQQLWIATKYVVERTALHAKGWELREAFYNIIGCFGVATSSCDVNDDEYEVDRRDLQDMYDSLVNQDERYRTWKEYMETELNGTGTTLQQFTDIIKMVLERSDQSNEWILISWW